ncbi:MAG: hypothetical protein AB203_00600 [Parcubacteria bacterium C7867-008]|nr:MAG: hypothetical protein AB203_00600 [Parcubacteria bacterium C7867-008]
MYERVVFLAVTSTLLLVVGAIFCGIVGIVFSLRPDFAKATSRSVSSVRTWGKSLYVQARALFQPTVQRWLKPS